MRLSPDEIIFWQSGFFKLNATLVFTWALMLVLAVGAKLITRKLTTDHRRSRWQNLLEIVVTLIAKQIEEVGLPHPKKYLGFLGTLFLFVAAASLCTVIPGFEPPTGSLSTTAALGLWLDRRFPGGRSWTLALLVVGLTIGCLNAWFWVSKEDKAMRDEPEDDHE
jgi:F-type H+-transporting ATPase subunit a